MDSIKDKLIPAIDDTRVLVHVFIVIFFFEDYLIITQQTSLLNTTISFSSIPLQPFVIFFAALAVGRLAWWYIHLSIEAVKQFRGNGYTGDQSKRDSYTSFLLFASSLVYCWQFAFNESIRPLKWAEHPYWFGFFCIALIATVGFSFYIGIWRGTDYSDGDEKK
ncbi:MAG TPA: hypothetical protein VJ508_09535 [Saprospiraceae bacterium]|nr:hypothetical protein [Saprospiraceae bacterium]